MEKIDGKNFKTHDVIFKKEEKDSFKQYKRQISKTNMLRQVFDLVTQAIISLVRMLDGYQLIPHFNA